MDSISFELFFPYAIPLGLSLLACIFLASLTIQVVKIKRKDQFFTIKGTVRYIVLTGYLAIIPLGLWVIMSTDDDISIFQSLYKGFIPLMTFLVCLFLSILSLRIGETQRESLIFSVICLLFAFGSVDLFFNINVSEPSIAWTIRDMDYLFLVFLPPLFLHLTYLVINREKKWWIVYTLYGLVILSLPLTQTPYYFLEGYIYYLGFHGQGVIFSDIIDVILFIILTYGGWVVIFGTIAFSSSLLLLHSGQTDNTFLKHRSLLLFWGFVSMGLLALGHMIAVHGYEIVTLEKFIFVPVLLSAYGMFRPNWTEALQTIKAFMFSVGILVAVIIVIAIIEALVL